MPPDQTQPQNPISTENTLPTSPQEPLEQATENTGISEPSTMPSEAPESSPISADAIPVNNDNLTKNEPEAVRLENKPSFTHELLAKAQFAIQFRKRKKLDKIMSLFLEKSKITNDEVEKLLHVSDATATRYLSILEKEGKIKQNSRTGKSVSYSRI